MDFFKDFGSHKINSTLLKFRKKAVYGKGLLSFLFNEGYIIKKGLCNKINANKSYIKGVVLDFGCGEKPYKNLFGYEKYIGVDYKSSGHDNSMNDVDVYWDGNMIPIENETFDSFICSEVLEHVFNIDTTLNEIYRVLKKGGTGIITIPFMLGEHEIPYDFARYTYYGIEDILTKHNFKIIKHERLGNTYTTLLQMQRSNISYLINKITKLINNKRIGWFLYELLSLPFQIVIMLLAYAFSFLKGKNTYLNNFIIIKKI